MSFIHPAIPDPMNDFQGTYLKMFHVLAKIMDENAAAWSANPACVNLKARLDAAIAGMEQSLADQMETAGAARKKAARAALIAALSTHANALMAYAIVAEDAELLVQVKLTPRKLLRATGLSLMGLANRISNLAQGQLLMLAPYGITAATVADLQTKTSSFGELLDSPAAARRQRADYTAALETHRKAGLAACRQLDTVLRLCEEASPGFVEQCRIARKLIKQGHRKRALQVRVTDAAGKPVALAMISIPSLKVKRKSTEKGQAYFQHLHPGEHLLRVEAEGYTMKEVPVVIQARERTMAEVML